MKHEVDFDVAIVGGGVVGAADLYVLSHYTNIERIAIFEKQPKLGLANSHEQNNSQTLHFGDIEANYSLEKVAQVDRAAKMLVRYLLKHGQGLFRKTHKMVLAVGAQEVEELNAQYEKLKILFPKLERIGPDKIGELEPRVLEGRSASEPLLALLSADGYAVNFREAAESFFAEALETKKPISVFLGTKVLKIKRVDSCYELVAEGRGVLKARVLIVTAGPYSLLFAQDLGYGKDYAILPVAGSYYLGKNILHGKVYGIPLKGLPFAATHGDPDVSDPSVTRFGPTAKVLPLFERHRYDSFWDFLRVPIFTSRGFKSLFAILADLTILRFVLKNILYDIPLVGQWLFLNEVRKIVPNLKFRELVSARGAGGIRPQIVNLETKTLELGEAKIVGEDIIFNITPSPGASVCLGNAEKDAEAAVGFLGEGFVFDRERFEQDFVR